MKVGRNDPCPCGSGKKYKKCCLSTQGTAESTYRRVSAANEALVNKLLAFAGKELGDDFLDVAMAAFFFNADEDAELPVFDGFSQIFVPWALFTWRMSEEEKGDLDVELPLPADTTVAELYLQKKGGKLDSMERGILEAARRSPLSFHEILEATPGKGFRSQDLFTDRTHDIMEISASQALESGDVFFFSTAELEEFDILLGTSPVKFPPEIKAQVLELRAELKKEQGASFTRKQLLAHDADLRQAYLRLQGPDTVFDEDGDIHSNADAASSSRMMHYTIEAPEGAFEALHDLCCSETREEQLETATFDPSGTMTGAEILWNAPDDGPASGKNGEILDERNRGFITIKNTTMTVEVVFERDEAVIMDCINRRLGERAQLVAFEQVDFEGEEE